MPFGKNCWMEPTRRVPTRPERPTVRIPQLQSSLSRPEQLALAATETASAYTAWKDMKRRLARLAACDQEIIHLMQWTYPEISKEIGAVLREKKKVPAELAVLEEREQEASQSSLTTIQRIRGEVTSELAPAQAASAVSSTATSRVEAGQATAVQTRLSRRQRALLRTTKQTSEKREPPLPPSAGIIQVEIDPSTPQKRPLESAAEEQEGHKRVEREEERPEEDFFDTP